MITRTVHVGGMSLHTEAFGDQSRPTILLISGAMASARFWPDTFCNQLATAGYFVIRYDHRDMGLSSAVDYGAHPYMLDDLTRDAVAILDAYNIKKAHIVGHSMGGAISQLLALDYPDRVLSLTLISSAVLANAPLAATEQTALEKTWGALAACNKPTARFAESVDGFLCSYHHLHGDIAMDQALARAFIKDMYERSKPEHLAWFEKYSAGVEPLHNHVKAQQNLADRTSELKNIHVPVLIIHGQKDPLVLPRLAHEYCASFLPHVQERVIPDMGHMIFNVSLLRQIGDLIKEHVA